MHLNNAPSTSSLRFRWLVLATTVTTYALVVLGGVVRTTDSGDACPDWPRCHGQLIPPLDTNIMIEFSHRLLASVVGLLVVAVAVAAWRWQRGRPLIVWGAALAVGLVIAQIILGGATVLSELSPNVVMAHLALASALLATLVVLTVFSFEAPVVQNEQRATALRFRNLAIVALVATFGLMLSGSYVSGSGAALAVRDWPLFDGRIWPGEGRLAMIHATHRLVAAVVGVYVLYVAWRGLRDIGWHRAIAGGSALLVALFVAQIFVGAANIWTLLQPSAAAAHLALAAAIWAMLVAIGALAHRAAVPDAEAAAERRGVSMAQPQAAAGGGGGS